MLKIVDITVDYQKEFRELFDQVKVRFQRSRRTVLLYSIQWISVAIVCFLLINTAGAVALYIPFSYETRPARSDLQAKYGEWGFTRIYRVRPDIIEEIKRENTQNPAVYTNPLEASPYRDPFIIGQGESGNREPPIINTDPPGISVSKPTNTKLPDLPPTMTPIVTKTQNSQPTPTPSQTTSPTPPTQVIHPTNTPYSPTSTLPPTNTSVPPTSTSLPTNTSAPPVPPAPPTSTATPPTPTTPPTSTSAPPTSTSAPPTPTSFPTPTNQPWVLICHVSQYEGIPPITILVPPELVEWFLAHGDYLGACTSS